MTVESSSEKKNELADKEPSPRRFSIQVVADELTVHSAADQKSDALYVVQKGEILTVKSKNVDFDEDPWYLIRVRGDGMLDLRARSPFCATDMSHWYEFTVGPKSP